MPSPESAPKASRVVPRALYRAQPWKNGGGTTYEIAREPAGDQSFSWRLSLARLERDGPFSEFTGYVRALTLVSGGGCRLLGARAEPVELQQSGAAVLFDGGSSVSCELIAGACEDLNLMVRKPGRIDSVDHFSLPAHEPRRIRADCFGAAFCLEGGVDCLHLPSGERLALGLHDSLLVAPADAANWRLMRGDATSARVVVLAWRADQS